MAVSGQTVPAIDGKTPPQEFVDRVRVLAEFAQLTVPDDRLAKVEQALAEFLSRQTALDELALHEVAPGSTFDPRWP